MRAPVVTIVCLVSLIAPISWGAESRGAEANDDAAIPHQLSLEQALAHFRAHGFDLLVAEANVASAKGDLTSARQVQNPGAGYTYSRILNYDPALVCPGGASNCSPNVHAVYLTDNNALEDVLSGKRGLRVSVAEAALKAAQLGRDDAQRTLEYQVASQYMQAVLARDQLDFSLEVQAGWTKTLELVQLRHQRGAISEADEAKVETEKLEADQAVLAAQQNLLAAKVALGFLLGVRDGAPTFEVAADLPKYQVPERLADARVETLLPVALQKRPDLLAQQAQIERAEASIAKAKRARFPDLQLQVGFSYAAPGGGGFSSNTVPPTPSIGLSGTLPVFYQQQGEIEHAQADLVAQRALTEKAKAQVVSDLVTAVGAFTSAKALVERMQGRLLDRAKTARDLTKLQYEKGAASLLELLDAERTFIGTNSEYLQDLAGYWIAVFQVELAMGGTPS